MVALLAGALACAGVAPAQQTPPPRPTERGAADTVRVDSVAHDSLGTRRTLTAADTIKRALTESYQPAAYEFSGSPRRWDRDALFSSGALTLGELLQRVPGVTLMTTGFLIAPAVLAWHGDPGGIRVYIDGIERDEVARRAGGVTEYAMIPLWAFEDVRIEETAGALRVHARSWRVERTTPATRTDVLTGSENLNLFRGFFGKRAANGVALQMAAQQSSTVSVPGMDGEALGAFGRLGWAAGDWSVDVTVLRQGLDRTVGARYLLTASPDGSAVPAFKGSSTLTYARLGWRQSGSAGPWIQLVAASSAARATVSTGSASDSTADSTASRSQLFAQGGWNRGGLRLAGTLRLRPGDTTRATTPSLRAEWAAGRLGVSAHSERVEGKTLWDVRAAADPLSWLRVVAGVGRSVGSAGGSAADGIMAEAQLANRGRWLGGGIRKVAATQVLGPTGIDSLATAATLPAATGAVLRAGGPLWRDFQAQTEVTRWASGAPYRPQMQAWSRVWFASGFPGRFEPGTFHVMAALTHEYRGTLYVPKGADPVGQSAVPYRVFGSLLEIRISSAVLTWDYRNMTGRRYETFPGFIMPRIVNVYGIRWEFWN